VIASQEIAKPSAGCLLASAIICQIVGSLVFVFSSNTRLGASLLLVFLVPTRLIFCSIQSWSGAQLPLAAAALIGQR